MAQQSRVRRFVIGRDTKAICPRSHSTTRLVGAFRLDAAALNRYNIVRALFKESRIDAAFPRGDGVLRLISIAFTTRRRVQYQRFQALSSDAIERIKHALPLNLALRLIVDMPEITAAAALRVRAEAVDAMR